MFYIAVFKNRTLKIHFIKSVQATKSQQSDIQRKCDQKFIFQRAIQSKNHN